jgi:eukaryotic translation initiation factor 2C
MMIFGADVTHPSVADSKLSESIAAVTGSLDPDCCFYAARLYAQKTPKGQAYEMIHDLDKMVYELLVQHRNRNQKFPNKIMFFRDGVSEGQFSLVLRWEMNKIRNACMKIHNDYKPAITFVVVQKRHHTRFFPARSDDFVNFFEFY